ncbi:hypothetical protein GCM10027194_03010 [Thalassiella azotivora]
MTSGAPVPVLHRRAVVVLAATSLAALLVLAASRTWLVAQVSDPLTGVTVVDVTGGRAAPVVPALGLVALAAAGALTIARRVGSLVGTLVLAAAGLGAVAAALRVVAVPGEAARSAAAEVAGVTPASVDVAGVPVSVTAWAWVAAVVAAALVLVSGHALVARRGWGGAGSGSRFERGARSATTSAAPGSSGSAVGGADGADGAATEEPTLAWDALDRGEDPTRGGDGPPS